MLSDFFFYVFKIVGFYFYVDSKIESAEISHLPQLPLMCGLCYYHPEWHICYNR